MRKTTNKHPYGDYARRRLYGNKRRVLVIHHIEEMWQESFNPYVLPEMVRRHVEAANYDKIIISTLQGTKTGYWELDCLLEDGSAHLEDWGYAWGYGNEDDPDEVACHHELPYGDIIPATGHQWAYVYPWIKALKEYRVSICGGLQDECLQDLADTLDYLQIEYRPLDHLIY